MKQRFKQQSIHFFNLKSGDLFHFSRLWKKEDKMPYLFVGSRFDAVTNVYWIYYYNGNNLCMLMTRCGRVLTITYPPIPKYGKFIAYVASDKNT